MRFPPVRHWFQFRLRTILVIVAGISVLLAYEARTVVNRRAAMKKYAGMTFPGEPSNISWIRQVMGDRSYYQIQVKQGNGLEIRDELKALFPESKVEYDCWSYPGYELGPPYAYGKPAGRK